MVDCSRMSVIDGVRRAIEGTFGPPAGVLWQDAWDGVDPGDKPYGCWSVPTMDSFLRRQMKVHGISRLDFESSEGSS